MTDKGSGVIYILTNPSFPDYVKIGYATDLDTRLQQLNSSECTPFAFRAYATYEVPVSLSDKKLHSLIDKLNPDLRSIDHYNGHTRIREFYAMSPQDAYSILEAIAGMHGFESRLKLIKPSEGEVEEMQVAEEIAKDRRSRFSFDECEIPYGSTLDFWYTSTKPSDIRCTVLDDHHVEYEGDVYTLSGLAGMLLDRESVRGTSYFKYNGEWLNTIRERIENARGLMSGNRVETTWPPTSNEAEVGRTVLNHADLRWRRRESQAFHPSSHTVSV